MEETLAEQEDRNLNSSSSSSSSDDDDEAAEDLRIKTLEKSVAENPFDYDTNVQYIQSLRKFGRLKQLRQARESMNERFPLSSEMWQEWIKDEVSLCTRSLSKLYNALFQASKSGSMLEIWQSYISMEIELGQINEARSIYKRCYSKRFSGTGSEDVCHFWLRFEREHGTLDDFDLAQKKVAPRLQELMAFKAQQETKGDLASVVNKDGPPAASAPQKRKIGKALEVKQPPGKRKKYTSEPVQASERDSIRAPEQIKLAEETDKGQVEKLLDTDAANNQAANEDHLREFFKNCGVIAIRLLKDRKTGEPRGLAYVDFSDDEHLAAAVAKNKQKLLGKKLSIARSDPKRSQKRILAASKTSAAHGKRFARGNSIRKDESEATIVDKRGSSGKLAGSVTFAAPRALVKPLGWTKREAKPDQDNEKPKSNDEFRDMLLKKRTVP
ncbi:Suppressor of forked protein (Suf) [Musa troglodytarum]|uniref:Suppressor of forked protein (Suf) n=1 Tax=Musa troglodytarum TaxID=320322 RepID=A0A9E7HEJ1_9LILI|nr:Suppressor of forked protein (Suf) [Musa troglodytarum]